MTAIHFARGISGGGWTIEASDEKMVVSGGSHRDAYGPLEIPHDQLETLILDLRALSSAAQDKPTGSLG